MEDRQRLEGIINELNAYKAQADMLNQQVETLKTTIADLTIAQETLDAIKGKQSPETLVPIGAGSFLITEIKNTEEVIVGLGSGAAVKKNIDDAKESIEEQKKELDNIMQKMMSDLTKISQIISQKSPEAEELIQKIEGTPG
ncbi:MULTISPECIES: prefoldin subunit alpha [Methanobacterium]|jgi:prefoldin alpha subunit|uniref:Prefoldin subunit alpha n=1 Tax=Methanobacterium subterraneum TaxID=59277 RepID=A0A2H4VQI9_9EURY|nr:MULTISPECIES: prefoldin subunit alpha [Methanobacterium]MBW4258090.1 prefoldin subunit alpha [Methanobacterium sp. YSL]PKL73806.1 MAG: prefoldin subunit alpha [Methanobacteriales archaeon HGW-Methanobacteriales-2]AUB55799.1 prefoldin subunit alpha [Methanobacterium subterraneum]AUB57202.1 prefoldin subunit alpha [Methanobacterium sp. MZ-A1]AUB60336.1 prefoldin subunit alpha [Methanobacterium subterraneum]